MFFAFATRFSSTVPVLLALILLPEKRNMGMLCLFVLLVLSATPLNAQGASKGDGVKPSLCALDLTFLFDNTASQTPQNLKSGIAAQVNLSREVCHRFDIGDKNNETRVAGAMIQDFGVILWNFTDGNSKPKLHNLSESVLSIPQKAGTRLGYTLQTVCQNLYNPDPELNRSGDRENITDVLIVFTDGSTQAGDRQIAIEYGKIMREKGVTIVTFAVVGSAGLDMDLLVNITGGERYVFLTDQLSSLISVIDNLTADFCRVPSTPTVTTTTTTTSTTPMRTITSTTLPPPELDRICPLDVCLLLDCSEQGSPPADRPKWLKCLNNILDWIEVHPYTRPFGALKNQSHVSIFCIRGIAGKSADPNLYPDYIIEQGLGAPFLPDLDAIKAKVALTPNTDESSLPPVTYTQVAKLLNSTKVDRIDEETNFMRNKIVVINLEKKQSTFPGNPIPTSVGLPEPDASEALKAQVITPDQLRSSDPGILGYDTIHDVSDPNSNPGWMDLGITVTNDSMNKPQLIDRPLDCENIFDMADLRAMVNKALSLVVCPPGEVSEPPTTIPPPDFCHECWERRGQIDYVMNPENCSEFYHCWRDEHGFINSTLMACPPGERFDDLIRRCVPRLYAENCSDPCRDTTVMMQGFWQHPFQCGIFYQCSNYYSIKMCCPVGQRFNISWGDCMRDKTCVEHEEECAQRVTVPMWTPVILDNETCWDVQYNVKRRLVPGNDHEYQVLIDDMTVVDMWCPPGTAFELETCKCTNHSIWEVTYPPFIDCLVDIDFNNKTIIDKSVNKFWIDNMKVGGSEVLIVPHQPPNNFYGLLDGMSHIEIPGAQGNPLGRKVTIMFWIKWLCIDSDGDAGIISNRGDFNIEPSILIRRQGNVIFAGFRTNKQNMLDRVSRELACDLWWHITVTWDDGVLSLYVNCMKVDDDDSGAPGSVYWMMHCPLAVGNDQKEGYFRGCIDDLKICRFLYTDSEICDIFEATKDASGIDSQTGTVPTNPP